MAVRLANALTAFSGGTGVMINERQQEPLYDNLEGSRPSVLLRNRGGVVWETEPLGWPDLVAKKAHTQILPSN
jgi:hypothetical protein